MTTKKSPFESLAALRDALPKGPDAPAAKPTETRAPDPFAGKVVVAKSRKGRGGRTVTTISGIAGGDAILEPLARDLRTALGCGAVVEEDRIVVQGELEDRVRAFLEARGARRVIMGT